MAEAKERLSTEYFTSNLGFSPIKAINFVDGVRIIFNNNDISHLRPSGNAPEFRNYATADTQQRAEEIVKIGLEKILPKMREEV
jgi:phosphomannomutase